MLKKRLASAAQLDGVIDLERLRSGASDCIERDAGRFFDLTFPTQDAHALVRTLSQRFVGEGAEGTVLAQAVKGLGKSHSLLIAYHLFNNPVRGQEWLKSLGYTWTAPADTVVLVHKFTDRSIPDDALWMLVGNQLGTTWDKNFPPDVDVFLAAIGSRHLVLILDELERGIQGIVNDARRVQNLNFLQMLSEAANRDRRVTLIAAIYDGTVEPGATLRRTRRLELRFNRTEDRAAIVRHRLFADAQTYDRESARALIQSYVNTWKRFGVEPTPQYILQMESSFPFLPDLVELVFTRIGEHGGFQGTRSALGLLGAMLDASSEGAQLMSAASCLITDSACMDRLQDLNPTGDLINCAKSNYAELINQPFAAPIASATLLASLVPGEPVGLSKDELVRHVVQPGSDPNEFLAALESFRKYGTYFHEVDGRVRFDRHENERAKVQLASNRFSDEAGREQLIKVWLQDGFRDSTETVVFEDVEQARRRLEELPIQGRRIVLAPRRLSSDERHALYVGTQKRNQILLIEPRDSAANHLANADLLAYAKRIRAANDLANAASSSDARRRYEDIRSEESRHLLRLLSQAGLTYVRVEHWVESPAATLFEEEPLGQANSKQAVIEQLQTGIYPPSLIAEHLRDRLSSFHGQTVAQVDRAYRSTLGFPVPLNVPAVTRAVRSLVEDSSRILGLKHARLGGGACGELVNLSESEFDAAELSPPWPKPLTGAPAPTSPGMPTAPAEPAGSSLEPVPGPAPGPTRRNEDRSTPSCSHVGELRMQIASKLIEFEQVSIQSVRFSIFAPYREAELSGLPSAFRGALTGAGEVDVQLELNLPGPFTKAQIEALCDKLPVLAGGSYSARMKLEIPLDDEATRGEAS